MPPLDILYIVLAVCTIFVAVPLSLTLWRVYRLMDRVERILAYIEKVKGLAMQLESVPMKIVESVIEFAGKKK